MLVSLSASSLCPTIGLDLFTKQAFVIMFLIILFNCFYNMIYNNSSVFRINVIYQSSTLSVYPPIIYIDYAGFHTIILSSLKHLWSSSFPHFLMIKLDFTLIHELIKFILNTNPSSVSNKLEDVCTATLIASFMAHSKALNVSILFFNCLDQAYLENICDRIFRILSRHM